MKTRLRKLLLLIILTGGFPNRSQASPFKTTLIIELSNCIETIYIPTRAAYAGGSYEVTNSSVQPGSGELLVETALKLLRELATTK